MAMVKKILLISTGGTIAQSVKETTLALNNKGDKNAIKFAQILESAKNNLGIDKIEPIEHIDEDFKPLNKDSSNIVPDDWRVMIDAIAKHYNDYDAFLITHGTNTLAYTCAALSFALSNLGKPVILTGSQVALEYPGSDAILNLENAIRVAANDEHTLAGVLAVFGSNIMTGTRVKKINEFSYDAFKSFGTNASIGQIGRKITVNEDALRMHLNFLEPKAQIASQLNIAKEFDMRIASITEFPGMTSEYLINLVDSGVKGIIYRASGVGDPNIASAEEATNYTNLRDGFEYLQKKKVPVVVTTYAPDGIASMDVNEPGILARGLGAIPGWDMSIETMTVKLAWMLGQKMDYERICADMTRSLKGEIIVKRR